MGRMKHFRDELTKRSLDAALISKKENLIYLSGFTGGEAYLLITADKALLFTDFRYVEQASQEAVCCEIVMFKGSLMDAINERLKPEGVQRLGFEEDYLSYSRYVQLESKLDVKEFVPLKKLTEELRSIKDPEEIDSIKKAVQIADSAFLHVLKYIKPGITEIEIANELEYFIRKQGATGVSFETIVASGKRSSMPHGVAGDKAVEYGDTIILDFGAYFNHYCSDMTRTVFLGEVRGEMREVYGIVLEAQLEAINGVKAGMEAKEVDSLARGIIEAHGYGENFGHSLGHGVGLEVHEEPRLSANAGMILQNSMAVTIEPGIYVSGAGGVRIEDIVVINGDEPVVLTQTTKEMIVL